MACFLLSYTSAPLATFLTWHKLLEWYRVSLSKAIWIFTGVCLCLTVCVHACSVCVCEGSCLCVQVHVVARGEPWVSFLENCSLLLFYILLISWEKGRADSFHNGCMEVRPQLPGADAPLPPWSRGQTQIRRPEVRHYFPLSHLTILSTLWGKMGSCMSKTSSWPLTCQVEQAGRRPACLCLPSTTITHQHNLLFLSESWGLTAGTSGLK